MYFSWYWEGSGSGLLVLAHMELLQHLTRLNRHSDFYYNGPEG
jgi:hypothetical protein